MDTALSQWNQWIDQGNEAFDKQNWSDALGCYISARRYAYEAYQSQGVSYKYGLLNVLITHFNSADTYLKLEQQDEATSEFIECFRFIKDRLSHAGDNEALQRDLINAYAKCRTEWLLFKTKVDVKDPTDILEIDQAIQALHTMH